jgi:cytochrome c oxidase subunit 2
MPSLLQSMLHPAGADAAHISWLWWVMFGVTVAVWVLVVGALGVAVARSRSPRERPSERAMTAGVAAATGASIAVLLVLLAVSVVTGNAISAHPGSSDVIDVEITGQQWWWQVTYRHPVPSQQVTTANELYLPVGRAVLVALRSTDVIHSFWVPALHGKVDLIPGRQTSIVLRAERAGEWRGQCAEFCGLQHAHMRMVVVAMPQAEFDAWYGAQLQPAAPPATDLELRGRTIVERGTCAMCHTVRGTAAGGRMGPDLTHMGSRRSIGAGTLANTPEYLAQWIADPPQFKPGTRMPPPGLSAADLEAVVAYLGRLR